MAAAARVARVPFRSSFSCLWCGRAHTVRDASDLEGFAQLCPDCVGRAGENPFLRHRLKSALAERSAALEAAKPAAPATPAPAEFDHDDWYLRRGRYRHDPMRDLAWSAELDAATGWLDRLPLAGEIVELAAGSGWWSPLLAQKGVLSIYDALPAPLDRARERLIAHDLRAHIHVRDPWAEPDRAVDALFTSLWLGRMPAGRLDEFVRLCHRWLKVNGLFAFIEARRGEGEASAEQLGIPGLADTPDELERRLRAAGFHDPQVTTTGRFLVLGRASA